MNTTIIEMILLICGIIAPLLNFITDRIVGGQIKGYSFSAQSISELSAIGSPKRTLFIILSFIVCLFITSFGIGVWIVSEQSILIRIIGLLIIGNSIFGLIATIFFPIQYGKRPKFLNIGVLIMFFSVLFFIFAIIIGAIAINGWFRIFSIAIPIAYILLAILRYATTSKRNNSNTVSLIGSQERTMSYSYLLWVVVFAFYLLSIRSI